MLPFLQEHLVWGNDSFWDCQSKSLAVNGGGELYKRKYERILYYLGMIQLSNSNPYIEINTIFFLLPSWFLPIYARMLHTYFHWETLDLKNSIAININQVITSDKDSSGPSILNMELQMLLLHAFLETEWM